MRVVQCYFEQVQSTGKQKIHSLKPGFLPFLFFLLIPILFVSPLEDGFVYGVSSEEDLAFVSKYQPGLSQEDFRSMLFKSDSGQFSYHEMISKDSVYFVPTDRKFQITPYVFNNQISEYTVKEKVENMRFDFENQSHLVILMNSQDMNIRFDKVKVSILKNSCPGLLIFLSKKTIEYTYWVDSQTKHPIFILQNQDLNFIPQKLICDLESPISFLIKNDNLMSDPTSSPNNMIDTSDLKGNRNILNVFCPFFAAPFRVELEISIYFEKSDVLDNFNSILDKGNNNPNIEIQNPTEEEITVFSEEFTDFKNKVKSNIDNFFQINPDNNIYNKTNLENDVKRHDNIISNFKVTIQTNLSKPYISILHETD